MYVDKFARHQRHTPEFELRTFYGQIQHIYTVHFENPTALATLQLLHDTVSLAAVQPCILDGPSDLHGLDIHFYSRMGALDIVDITTLQCVVGRVRDTQPGTWGIIDRSGTLARALSTAEDSEN